MPPGATACGPRQPRAALAAHLAPDADLVARLATIPGVGPRTAEVLVAEVGTDVACFASADHLTRWAGVCPGQAESGGKQAAVAVARHILEVASSLIRDGTASRGPAPGPRGSLARRSDHRRHVLAREPLGYHVSLQPRAA